MVFPALHFLNIFVLQGAHGFARFIFFCNEMKSLPELLERVLLYVYVRHKQCPLLVLPCRQQIPTEVLKSSSICDEWNLDICIPGRSWLMLLN